ncbi:hypothetical protein KAFR_0I00870 [Kazachstania africana CBS 2517]|uniref:Uncharacterized protein n=1 Tax=Kazachstania africana (strain ATCC 22294 / BCRC 22015 / CBS 2517 / CECT 1963 / NBRC 1671 / NRRL Y-8276) TaxID=1071382 RepID=H2AZR8_KAZAF|nr:hypothetical protein KAFR_0I00870 [Kazachstania africana CBS 2517]CCF59868.1 hypothetical protein KAFR_0I00870 [Kazachstania africana CBS 2517]
MSTLVQLISNYYKSVEKAEKIYNHYIAREPNLSTTSSAPKIVNETLLLQKQLSDLTSQVQNLKRENDNLKESIKLYKALNESKISNYKKIIDNLQNDNTVKDNKDFSFHLLSPVIDRKRSVLGSHTIFDKRVRSDSDEVEDVLVKFDTPSLKDFSNDDDDDDDDDDEEEDAFSTASNTSKKRKLTKRKINNIRDDDNDNNSN